MKLIRTYDFDYEDINVWLLSDSTFEKTIEWFCTKSEGHFIYSKQVSLDVSSNWVLTNYQIFQL